MSIFAFAFGAGLLATVNPCGFAMLPAFLAYYLGDTDDPEHTPGFLARLAQGLGVGLAVSAGFAGVFMAAGLLVSAGLRSLVRVVPWAAVVIGAALAVVGLAMVAGRHLGFSVGERLRPGQGRGYRHIVVFGAAYALASLSCTLAVLLAVVAQATATDNPLQMLGVFAAYGLGAASVLVTLAVSAALAKAAFARAVRRLLPVAGRLAGGVLVASGVYLIAYWLPALGGSSRGSPLGGFAEDVSSRLTGLLDANRGLFATLGLGFLVLGAVVAVWRRWGGRGGREGEWAETMPAAEVEDCCAPPLSALEPDPDAYASTGSSERGETP